MKNLTFSDLYNPNKIEAIIIWKGEKSLAYESDTNTAFQEYPRSIELWGLHNGNLIKLQRWLKKSVTHATYSDDPKAWETLRPYIN